MVRVCMVWYHTVLNGVCGTWRAPKSLGLAFDRGSASNYFGVVIDSVKKQKWRMSCQKPDKTFFKRMEQRRSRHGENQGNVQKPNRGKVWGGSLCTVQQQAAQGRRVDIHVL